MATPDRIYGAKKRHDLEVALYARIMSRVAVAKSQGDTIEKAAPIIPALMAGARALAPRMAGLFGTKTAGAATAGAATGAASAAGGAAAGGATGAATGATGAAGLGAADIAGDVAGAGTDSYRSMAEAAPQAEPSAPQAEPSAPKAEAPKHSTASQMIRDYETAQTLSNAKANAEQKRQQQIESAKEAATRHANTQKGHKIAFDHAWNILKFLPGAQTTLPSFDEESVRSAVEGDKKKVYISSKPGSEDIDLEEQQNRHNNLLDDLKNLGGGTQIFSGKGHSPWGEEYSLMLNNVQEDDMSLIQQLASHYGQEAIAITGDEEGPRFETPGGEITDRFSSEGLANANESPDFFTQFGTGQKSVLS